MINYFQSVSTSFVKLAITLFIGLATSQSAYAATTLSFDEYADGTVLTTQYQGVGVTISGATIIPSAYTAWAANTGPNFAYAPTGLMTFSLNSAITGNIQSVSAYISGDTSVGIYAYDSTGALVGQALTPGASNNLFLSLTSSGNPIASIAIHDGGSSFAIDTLSFIPAAPLPPPPPTALDIANQYSGAISALSANDFRSTLYIAQKKALMLRGINDFKKLLAKHAGEARLIHQIRILQIEVKAFITATTPAKAELLDLLHQLKAAVDDDHDDDKISKKRCQGRHRTPSIAVST